MSGLLAVRVQRLGSAEMSAVASGPDFGGWQVGRGAVHDMEQVEIALRAALALD